MRCVPPRPACLAPLLLLAFWAGGTRGACLASTPPQAVPRSHDLVLDGRLAEPGWRDALLLPAGTLEVPAPPGSPTATQRLAPEVRVLEAGGALWVGVEVPEDPGTGIGLRVMAASGSILRAAEAVAVGYAPCELRAPRWSVRSPRGATRAYIPVEGAVDTARRGAWSLELRLPLAALDLPREDAPLALALAVATRVSNLVASVPADLGGGAPAAWPRLVPAAGAWSQPAGAEPAQALAEADAADDERMAAWRRFLATTQAPAGPGGMLAAPESAWVTPLLGALDEVQALRADLAPWLAWVRGDLLWRFGQQEAARACWREALAAVPGHREAAYGLEVLARGMALAAAPPADGGACERAYERALAAAAAPAPAGPWQAYARDGQDLGAGLLLFKQGAFAAALERLAPLAQRYPAEALVVLHAERAREAGEAELAERSRRRAEEARADLPRLVLETTRGPLTLELFEDDAPQAVRHLVWLATQGGLEGLPVASATPFLGVEAGRDPGYLLAREASRRPPLRGTVSLLVGEDGSVGGRLFVATGTAWHLQGRLLVAGRLVAGEEAAGCLAAGDTIRAARAERLRPGTTYRPTTLAGEPAPAPAR